MKKLFKPFVIISLFTAGLTSCLQEDIIQPDTGNKIELATDNEEPNKVKPN